MLKMSQCGEAMNESISVTASLEDRIKKAAEAIADADLEGGGVPSYETLAADALAAAGVPALLDALTEARAEIDDWETDYHEVDGRLQAAEAALVGARKAALLEAADALEVRRYGRREDLTSSISIGRYDGMTEAASIVRARATEGPEQP